MSTFVTVLHVMVCLFLMLTVLLQSGAKGGMGAAFGGGNTTSVFGGAGGSGFLRKLTAGAAATFMITSMTLAFLASSGGSTDALKRFGAQQLRAKQLKDAAREKALEDAPGAGSATDGASEQAPGAGSATDVLIPEGGESSPVEGMEGMMPAEGEPAHGPDDGHDHGAPATGDEAPPTEGAAAPATAPNPTPAAAPAPTPAAAPAPTPAAAPAPAAGETVPATP